MFQPLDAWRHSCLDHAAGPLTANHEPEGNPPPTPKNVETCRCNPDCKDQFHIIMRDPMPDDASPVPTIPIVDWAQWTSSSPLDQRRLVAAQLISACKSIGFAYIINHQIPSARVEEAFSWSKRLFDLTLEEKKLAPHPAGSAVHRGYSWPGLEKVTNLKGDEQDANLVREELREVADVKVTSFFFINI